MKTFQLLVLSVILLSLLFCSNNKSHISKGDQWVKNWQLQKALDEYKMAFQQDSTDDQFLNKMGLLFLKLEYNADAVAAFDLALNLNRSAEIENNRRLAQLFLDGFQFIHEANYEGAVSRYKQILATDSLNAIAHKNIGLCYRALADSSLALKHFEIILVTLKDHPNSNLYQEISYEVSQMKK